MEIFCLLFQFQINQGLEFNAHRVYSYEIILEIFNDLGLVEFSLIPDKPEDGGLIRNADKRLCAGQHYACGCFHFTKKSDYENT